MLEFPRDSNIESDSSWELSKWRGEIQSSNKIKTKYSCSSTCPTSRQTTSAANEKERPEPRLCSGSISSHSSSYSIDYFGSLDSLVRQPHLQSPANCVQTSQTPSLRRHERQQHQAPGHEFANQFITHVTLHGLGEIAFSITDAFQQHLDPYGFMTRACEPPKQIRYMCSGTEPPAMTLALRDRACIDSRIQI